MANLEDRYLGCDTHQTVALDVVRRPKATPIHELEAVQDCSQVRGYPYKRSHLVVLRCTRISVGDPPSTFSVNAISMQKWGTACLKVLSIFWPRQTATT